MRGGHVVSAPFRSVTVDGATYWLAGAAWGQTEDQPRYVFAVKDPPDDEDRRAGFYRVPLAWHVVQLRDGRNPDENLAARDALRTIGASVIGTDGGRMVFELSKGRAAFDESFTDIFREARAWVAEKIDRERREAEDRRDREARGHEQVDGTFEEWDGRVAIVRMQLPGRKRRGLYRVPARLVTAAGS